jgi:transcriptional regulator with GAF, ATPase, and Fis domain
MTAPTREYQLFEAFTSLADTLVAGYDVVELLQLLVDTCQGALDVAEAGLLLANDTGELELVASTSESLELVETIQLSARRGPCIACFRSGRPVSVLDLNEESTAAWDGFTRTALEQGFRSVYALPLRLRTEVIGTLNLFGRRPEELSARDVRAAQALADVATIGILHERSFRANDLLRQQLQLALDSRVVIEQAKGVLAHTHAITPEEGFRLLRQYARDHQLLLAEVARRLVDRSLIF